MRRLFPFSTVYSGMFFNVVICLDITCTTRTLKNNNQAQSCHMRTQILCVEFIIRPVFVVVVVFSWQSALRQQLRNKKRACSLGKQENTDIHTSIKTTVREDTWQKTCHLSVCNQYAADQCSHTGSSEGFI